MATPSVPPFQSANWRAKDLKQLRKTLEELHPESDDEATERKFGTHRLTAEQAGDVFERWVLEAFRLSGARGGYSFRVPLQNAGSAREQIDGFLCDGWQGFLIESKFWTSKVDYAPIALLRAIVEARPAGTLGLFFSAFGYTAPALELADLIRPIQVLLFDRGDLEWALGGAPTLKGRMQEMVRRKWALALQYGRSYVPVSRSIEFFE
jgi:hypothetical protein